jgi:hypothetical protein
LLCNVFIGSSFSLFAPILACLVALPLPPVDADLPSP